MFASRFIRYTAATLGFAMGTAVLADDPAEARRKLKEAQLQLQLAQNRKEPPKAVPKPLAAPPVMPEGAIARLGDSRLRHAAPATCVTFSPDSRRLITGGEDGALRVWDVATGEAINALHLPSGSVAVARFTHGGTRLATTFSNSRLQFLNPGTLREESAFTLGFGNDFAVSDDGKLIAGIGPTGALVVTELGADLEKLELPIPSPANNHFAFRPDGKTIAVGDRTGKIAFYMLAGGKPIITLDHGGPINGLIISDDGKRIATGGNAVDNLLRVWDISDVKNQKLVAEIKGANKPQAWLGTDRIAAAGVGGAGVYDIAKSKWVGFAKGISGEWAISPDGTKLAAAGNGAFRVRMWDLATGKQLLAENDTFPDTALLAPAADGRSVFILAGDAAFTWAADKRAATPAGTLPAKAVAAATGAERLAVATADGILLYDGFDPAKSLPAKPTRTLSEFAAGARSVAVSPGGKKVAYSGDGTRIVIADASKGTTIRILPTQTIGLALAFSPDSSKLAVVGRDGFLRLWAAEPIAEGDDDSDLWKMRVQRGQRGAVAFSPDGKLVAASSSTLLLVVNAATGEEAFKIDRRDFEDGIFQQVAFSPDGRLLITGSAGLAGAVQVFEVATHSLVRRYTTGFGAVNRLGVFPDSTRFLSAGAEEVITVWDLSFRHGKDEPKADEMVAAWADLDSLDASKGFPAVRTLATGGSKGLRAIAAGLDDTLDTQKKIARWVKELGAEEFADREAATKGLLAQGFQAMPAVQSAAATAESQEVRTRAAEILDKMKAKGLIVPAHGLAGDTLRFVRAVQVLEDIGGAEAKSLLGKLAALGGRAGDAAKEALKRMEK